jgi:hypothetical protein
VQPEAGYSLDGLVVGVAGAPALVAAITRRFASIPRASGEADILVELDEVHDLTATVGPGGPARRLFEDDYDFFYHPSEDLVRLAADGVAASCDAVAGRIRILASPDDDRARFVASHVLLTISLLEVLKRRGRFAVHAGAVARHGRVILFCGPSGSGKTTVTLMCARAGFAFLGDDLAILEESVPGRLEVRAFKDEIGVTDGAATFLPELATAPDSALTPWRKRSIAVADVPGIETTDRGWPAALVFPAIRTQREPGLTAISPDDALVRLVPNVIRTEAGATQRHLDVLAQLARSIPAYRLDLGDPRAAPALLSSLVLGS